jgi:hypothetical protein
MWYFRTSQRLLSTSSCSSEDSCIEFASALDSQNKPAEQLPESIKSAFRRPALYVSDSEEEEEETDDDEDWDEVDDDGGGSLVDIPDEFMVMISRSIAQFCLYHFTTKGTKVSSE